MARIFSGRGIVVIPVLMTVFSLIASFIGAGSLPRLRAAMLAAGAQAAGLLSVCDALTDDMAAIGLPRG